MGGPVRAHRDEGRSFGGDALLNYVALGVAGLSGLGLLGLIGAVYGAAELGRFNLVFSTYLVASQLATLAIHHGVLHQLAVLDPQDLDGRRAVLRGALVAVGISAGASTLLLLAAAPAGAALAGRPDLVAGLRTGVVAAAVFAVNKVLLNGLTALTRLRAVAVATMLRGALLLGGGVVVVLLGLPGRRLPLILLAGEAVLTAALVLLLRRDLVHGRSPARAVSARARSLLRFGLRGSAGSILSDLNTRVDVLCLSLFVDDRAIGVYSLAAIIAEAVAQLPLVLRTVLSSRLTVMLAGRDPEGIRRLVVGVRWRVWSGMTVLGVAVTLLHGTFASLLGDAEFGASSTALAILLAGVVVASGYAPFSLMLVQGGDAAANSVLLAAVVAANLVGNVVLIPLIGIEGAATATTLSAVLAPLLLRALLRSRLGVRI